VDDGLITESGMTALREKLPHADFDALDKVRKVSHIQELFTVQFLVNFIEAKLLTAVEV